MGCFPDSLQIRMAQADDTECAIEEVGEQMPVGGVPMLWMFVPLKNPMGWHLRNNVLLRLMAARYVSYRRRGRLW